MVVSLQPEGRNTVVSTDTTYVLTKTVDAALPDGDDLGHVRETISFRTGESGTFSKGTQCQPNGRFERAVLDSLPATSFAAPRSARRCRRASCRARPKARSRPASRAPVIEAPLVVDSAPAVAEPPRATPSAPAIVEAPRSHRQPRPRWSSRPP